MTRIVQLAGAGLTLALIASVSSAETKREAHRLDPDVIINPLLVEEPPFEAASPDKHLSAIDVEGARASSRTPHWGTVYVDATAPAGPLGDTHRGFAQGGEDFRAPFFEGMAPHLRELGARLVRTDPLGMLEAIEVLDDDTCVIDWTNADRTVDALKEAGAKPMFNFTVCPAPWADHRGFPVNLDGWRDLVTQAVTRYNIERGDEIEYWELWNEPNHGIEMEAYFELYRVTVTAIKAVDPNAKVGGPAAASLDLNWIEGFLRFCSKEDLPVDFVSWHNYTIPPWQYPDDARQIRELVRKYFDHDLELALTEWGVDWRELEMNDNEISGAHALTSLIFLRQDGVEWPMFFEPRDGWDWKGPDRRFWSRWGILTSDLTRKAGFHAYAQWNRLGEETVTTSVDRENLWSLATLEDDALRVLVWNYPKAINRPEVLPVPTEHTGVTVQLRGIPWTMWQAERVLIDGTHSNAYHDLAREELERVETQAGQGPTAALTFTLRPYGVTAITLRPVQPDDDARNRGAARAMPETFELFGGLSMDVPLHVQGLDQAWLVEAKGRDGIGVEAIPGQAGMLRLTPPMVRAPRLVYLDATLAAKPNPGPDDSLHATDLGFLLRPSLTAEPERLLVDAEDAGVSVNIPYVLENHSPEPLSVAVRVTPPEGWWHVARMECVVPARDKITLELPLRPWAGDPDNPQVAAGAYDVSIETLWRANDEADEEVISDHVVRVGVPGVVVYRKEIKIDGDLSDWEGVPEIHIQPREGEDLGDNVLDARAWLAWNERGLYIAVDVEDDYFKQENVGLELWRGDSVCFAMDMLRDADGTSTYGKDDFEWGVAQTPRGKESFKWHLAEGFEGGSFKTLELEIIVDDRGHRYEMFMPWRELLHPAPKEGHVFGINISVNDDDPDGRVTLNWGNPIVTFKNPAGLVPVRLVRE